MSVQMIILNFYAGKMASAWYLRYCSFECNFLSPFCTLKFASTVILDRRKHDGFSHTIQLNRLMFWDVIISGQYLQNDWECVVENNIDNTTYLN